MKPEELAKLTPEEKRVRIAELCGWVRYNPIGLRDGSGRQWRPTCASHWASHLSVSTDLPDFLSDLNAMAAAENLHFTKPEHAGLANAYRGWLVNLNWEGPKGFDYSASERADAFLLTLG